PARVQRPYRQSRPGSGAPGARPIRRPRTPWRTDTRRTAAGGGRRRGSGASGRARGNGTFRTIGQARAGRQGFRPAKKVAPTPSQTPASSAQCAPRHGAVGSGRQGPGGGERKALHRVLTFSETALECAAPLTGRPSGRSIKGTLESAPKGVDESKNRAIMGGSLRRKSGRYGRRR